MPQEPTRPPRVTSAQRLAAFAILDRYGILAGPRLAAVVDAAACLIDHGSNVEPARLLLESIWPGRVADAALAALTEQEA